MFHRRKKKVAMIKLIILACLCTLALGQVDPPLPPEDQLPQLNRIARQSPPMTPAMGQTMGSAMPQPGNSGQGQLDTIDPLGLIQKSQNIAKEFLTGRKRRDVPDLQKLPLPPPQIPMLV